VPPLNSTNICRLVVKLADASCTPTRPCIDLSITKFNIIWMHGVLINKLEMLTEYFLLEFFHISTFFNGKFIGGRIVNGDIAAPDVGN
jgi:hypothetical protein